MFQAHPHSSHHPLDETPTGDHFLNPHSLGREVLTYSTPRAPGPRPCQAHGNRPRQAHTPLGAPDCALLGRRSLHVPLSCPHKGLPGQPILSPSPRHSLEHTLRFHTTLQKKIHVLRKEKDKSRSTPKTNSVSVPIRLGKIEGTPIRYSVRLINPHCPIKGSSQHPCQGSAI